MLRTTKLMLKQSLTNGNNQLMNAKNKQQKPYLYDFQAVNDFFGGINFER